MIFCFEELKGGGIEMVEENIEEKKEDIWQRKIIGWSRRKERKRIYLEKDIF